MDECNNVNSLLSRSSIRKRTSERWNNKTVNDRLHTSFKYKYVFEKYKFPINDWSNTFEKLSFHQQNILLKGELIRTYDSLTNRDKTIIKHKLGLSSFSSKWFKLSPQDKKILLNSVLQWKRNGKKVVKKPF